MFVITEFDGAISYFNVLIFAVVLFADCKIGEYRK